MKEANIEYQWQQYLKRAGVRESELIEVQKQEMKRAFFGAWGQLLILFRDDIGDADVSDDEGVEILQDMLNQVSNFWTAEVNRQN